MDAQSAREWLLGLAGITEHDHFGRPAYRATDAKGKPTRIFMTLWVEDNRAVLMLDTEQQAELHAHDPEIFFPVPNKWGAKGATFVELRKANAARFRSAVDVAIGAAGGAR